MSLADSKSFLGFLRNKVPNNIPDDDPDVLVLIGQVDYRDRLLGIMNEFSQFCGYNVTFLYDDISTMVTDEVCGEISSAYSAFKDFGSAVKNFYDGETVSGLANVSTSILNFFDTFGKSIAGFEAGDIANVISGAKIIHDAIMVKNLIKSKYEMAFVKNYIGFRGAFNNTDAKYWTIDCSPLPYDSDVDALFAVGESVYFMQQKLNNINLEVISGPTAVLPNTLNISLDTQIEIGQRTPLYATVFPSNSADNTVTWTVISGSNVINISSAGNYLNVDGINVGTARIRASTVNNIIAYVNITVNPKTVWVDSVSLNKNSLTLTAGNSETLIANVLPSSATNKNIYWSSNNPKVVSVVNGSVKAISEGSAIISVTTLDGKKVSSCNVLVNPNVVPVIGIALNNSQISLNIGQSMSVLATVSPVNATNKSYVWASGNTNVATVNNGTVTAISAGETFVSVNTLDGGKIAICKIIVNSLVPYEVKNQRLLLGENELMAITSGKLRFRTTIQNYYNTADLIPTVIVCVYKGNKFVKIEKCNYTPKISMGSFEDYYVDVDISEQLISEGVHLKAYIWNGLNNMKPISSTVFMRN
jgi:uncharacterized protein YjdB